MHALLVCMYSLWIGAFVGMVLKMASPHRSPAAWLFAGLVGALGGISGLFLARMFGISQAHWLAGYISSGLAAAGFVMLWAIVSRRMVASRKRRGRETRPTIVF